MFKRIEFWVGMEIFKCLLLDGCLVLTYDEKSEQVCYRDEHGEMSILGFGNDCFEDKREAMVGYVV